MKNAEIFKQFQDATFAYTSALREVNSYGKIHSIDIKGMIEQILDDMFEVESELLDLDEEE